MITVNLEIFVCENFRNKNYRVKKILVARLPYKIIYTCTAKFFNEEGVSTREFDSFDYCRRISTSV